MKRWMKPIAMIMTFIMLLLPMGEVLAGSISEAQEEKKNLEAELDKTEELIDGLKDSKDSIESKVAQLDAQLTNISNQINQMETKLDAKSAEIEDTKSLLAQAEEDEQTQYEAMKKRIQYMYENNNNLTYLEAFITSGNMSEFINQVEYIRQIEKYDREKLEQYQQTKENVTNAKATLEQDYEDLQELKAQVQQEQDAVEDLVAAKESELNNVSGELSDAQGTADVYTAEIQAQNDIIAQITAEEARKAAAKAAAEEAAQEAAAASQNADSTEASTEGETTTTVPEIPDDTYAGGVFTWPCPSSTRVTSDFGSRLSPTAGASSNHQGIDIGADYGAAIVAAADGTVLFAGDKGNGYGNYVMLSHGSGLYTIYGHASALMVSTGDTVTKGQTIAQVGSTGFSTGNHLHFGVSLNGSYVSPWNYLSK